MLAKNLSNRALSLEDRVLVFSYDFHHPKTMSFLEVLFRCKIPIGAIVAAPWVKLKDGSSAIQMAEKKSDAKELAIDHDVPWITLAHDDVAGIAKTRDRFGCSWGLVAGARIISQEVIDLFPKGILNVHPGPLPQSAGLGALFRIVNESLPLEVTAHFIDHRVDAGWKVATSKICLDQTASKWSDFELASLQAQNACLLSICRQIGDKTTFKCDEICRGPLKPPISEKQKRYIRDILFSELLKKTALRR